MQDMLHHFVAIEGNIGAGKTTLAHLLSKRLQARLILEEFAENPFLPRFYENPAQYAFPLELFFMAERYKQLKETVVSRDLFNTITVSDYLFGKCLLFAGINLQEEEFKLFQKLFEIMQQQLIPPDLIVYLHAPVARLQQNIKKRNRWYEQKIADEYLYSIQHTYSHYIKNQNTPVLLVDVSQADFLHREDHLAHLAQAVQQKHAPGLVEIAFPY
jgi:deoxyadenosine/deoxycytidine kinase